MPEPASYRRYVALGDSQTEGLNDGDDATGLRGWADRFAEALAATTSPGLHYANLALRGCRARDVRHGQLDAALAMQPDLASVVVGMNDLLRHDYDADATVRDVEETFAALRATGCRVVTMTFPDIGRMLPVMAWLRPREVDAQPAAGRGGGASRRRGAGPVPACHVRRPGVVEPRPDPRQPGGTRADRGRHGRAARAPGQRRVLERVRAVVHRPVPRRTTRRVVGRDLRRTVPHPAAARARSGHRALGQAPGPDARGR